MTHVRVDRQAGDRAVRLVERVRDTVLPPRAVQLHSRDRAVLRAAPRAVGLVLREAEAGDDEVLIPLLQLDGFLRVNQHVQRPDAHLAVA